VSSGLNIVLAIFIPWAMGFVALSFLFPRDELTIAARFALAFVVGTGLLTFLMLIWSLAGGSFSGIGLGVFISSITVICAASVLRYQHTLFKTTPPLIHDAQASHPGVATRTEFLWELLDIFIVIFLIFHCVYIFWRAFHIPVYGFDPLKINALNAKIFFFKKNIVLPLDPVYRGYPLHVSLLQTWLAINIGQWHDQVVKFFAPLYFAAYLVIQYEFVKFFMNIRKALWSLGLLLASNLFALHASLAYMDFPLMVYNCVTIMILLLWQSEREDRFLYLAAILAGMGTFVKREGTAYLFIYGILFVLMLLKDKNRNYSRLRAGMKFFLPCIILALIFPVFQWVHHTDSEGVLLDFSWQNLHRGPIILKQFFMDFFLSGNWNLVWPVLILRLFFTPASESHPLFKWLIMAVGLFAGLLFLLFLLSNAFFWIAERDTTLSRLILHFFPLATIAIVLSPGPQSGTGKAE